MAFLDETGLGKFTLNIKGMISLVQNVLTSHTTDYNNPHGVDASDVGLENVENKSSETIRSEITADNISDALGYVPTSEETVNELLDKISTELVTDTETDEPSDQETGEYWLFEY